MNAITNWEVVKDHEAFEINEDGKVRKIETRKYLPEYHDRLGRPLVIFHELKGATCEYIEDLLAVAFGPKPNQEAVVKHPDLVAIMPETKKTKRSGRRGRRILCIETGEEFSSYAECAKHYGFSYNNFYDTFKATGMYNNMHFEDTVAP